MWHITQEDRRFSPPYEVHINSCDTGFTRAAKKARTKLKQSELDLYEFAEEIESYGYSMYEGIEGEGRRPWRYKEDVLLPPPLGNIWSMESIGPTLRVSARIKLQRVIGEGPMYNQLKEEYRKRDRYVFGSVQKGYLKRIIMQWFDENYLAHPEPSSLVKIEKMQFQYLRLF